MRRRRDPARDRRAMSGKEVCPNCGSTHVLPLCYGYPAVEIFDAAERGEVALGGCLLDDTMRAWRCMECYATFNDGGRDMLAGP